MVVHRGEVWWANLPDPRGSEPGFRRPVVIVQSDAFNHSRIATIVAVAVTSNLRLLAAPGNVMLSAQSSGLLKDSVANLSQVAAISRADLTERVGRVDAKTMVSINRGLRLVLDL